MAQTKIKAGLFEGIIGNGTDGYFLMSNGDGTMTWSSVVINPTIVSIAYPGSATAADPAGGETITVTGSGFKTGATVTIGGTAAPAVSYVAESQITFTTPAKAAGDYDIVVTNTDTGSATYINGISYNGIPTWTNPAGSLGTFASDTTISTITLQATEPDAGTITFNITNGALPTGLSLTGADIDGTTSLETADTLYTFTVTATDDESQATPRTFTITVKKEFINTENFTINTYTGNGSTQSIEGKIGTAAAFNGSSSYVSASIPFLNAKVSSAVSLWIRYTDTGAYRSVFNDYSSTANFNHNIIVNHPSTGNVRFFSAYGGNTGYKIIESSGLTLNDGNWHHIVSTVDLSTNTLTGYVDGVSVGNVTVSTNSWTGTTQNLQIGRQESGAYFNGSVDQVRIFNRALDETTNGEVTTLYGENNTSTTKSTTDIFDDGSGIALYEFEEGAKDTGVYPFLGTVLKANNSPSNSQGSKVGWFRSDNLPAFNSASALSIWIKPSAIGFCSIYSQGNNASNSAMRMIINSSGNLELIRSGGYTLASSLSPNRGEWNHVVFNFNNQTTSFDVWLNGTKETVTGTFNYGSSPTEKIFGAFYDSNYGGTGAANGSIQFDLDHIRVYGASLSDADIANLYAEDNVRTSNLTAFYKLENTVLDETGNYNATSSSAIYGDANYNGTPTNVSFVGTSFQPDLVWIKSRTNPSNGIYHTLMDSVRGKANGFYKSLFSNSTDQEDVISGSAYTQAVNGGVSSFDTNGFTLSNGSGASADDLNVSSYSYVAWCWKAGGSVTPNNNTDGSDTTSVSANQDAGFSIVSLSKTDTNTRTYGHGLSSSPEMIILKKIALPDDWLVYHKDLGNTVRISLNSSAAKVTGTGVWGSTTPTDSVFTLQNQNGGAHIAYCFHSVDGYQKVGSYSGGSSGSSNVITTGFKPRFLLVKRTDASGDAWQMFDSIRGAGDTFDNYVQANTSAAEASYNQREVNFTNNGFYWTYAESGTNISGGTYIYLAIA